MTVHPDSKSLGYRLAVAPLSGETVASCGDHVLAASQGAKLMHETRLPSVVYFPQKDVKAKLLLTSDHRTFCPFKGTATYWDVEVGGRIYENGAWSYKNAIPEARDIEGMVSFMPNVLGSVDIKDADAGTIDYGNISGPTIDWIMREAWLCGSPEELTEAIARKFNEDGIAVSRMSVMIWSLHPMIAGRNYVWSKRDGKVNTYTPSYDLFNHPNYVNSPLRHVANGLGGVRQNLLSEKAEFSFPIMEELKSGRRDGLCSDAAAVLQRPDQRHDDDQRPSGRLHNVQSRVGIRVLFGDQPALRGVHAARQRVFAA